MKLYLSLLMFLTFPSLLLAQSIKCTYLDEQGHIKQVSSPKEVPARFIHRAKCEALSLAAPEDIKLEGSLRREVINSELGPIDIRWPRKVEMLFGRNPLKATVEAARTVSRTLKRASFPPEIQRLNVPWKIVFMDANLPQEQIPTNLITNCHPGWMTPPSNIYIVAQRVAQGCHNQSKGASVADSTLAQVLVHEMGHAVEYHILKQQFGKSRMRAEGFAVWFTRFAASSSSMLNKRKIQKDEYERAIQHKRLYPNSFTFDGSSFAYARASMYQEAIVNRYGVSGLMKVYNKMKSKNLPFINAIKATYNWTPQTLEKEVNKILKKNYP